MATGPAKKSVPGKLATLSPCEKPDISAFEVPHVSLSDSLVDVPSLSPTVSLAEYV